MKLARQLTIVVLCCTILTVINYLYYNQRLTSMLGEAHKMLHASGRNAVADIVQESEWIRRQFVILISLEGVIATGGGVMVWFLWRRSSNA
jgi:hypothetical protein